MSPIKTSLAELKDQFGLNEHVQYSKEYKQAWQFSRQPQLLNTIELALHTESLRTLAVNDPDKFLKKAGVSLPKNLNIEFSLVPGKFKPSEQNMYDLIFSNCRTYFVKDDPADPTTWHSETVCLALKVFEKFPFVKPVI